MVNGLSKKNKVGVTYHTGKRRKGDHSKPALSSVGFLDVLGDLGIGDTEHQGRRKAVAEKRGWYLKVCIRSR